MSIVLIGLLAVAFTIFLPIILIVGTVLMILIVAGILGHQYYHYLKEAR